MCVDGKNTSLKVITLIHLLPLLLINIVEDSMIPFSLDLKTIKAVIFDLDNTLVTSNINFSQLRQQLGCPQDIDLLSYIETLNTNEKTHANNIVFEHELSDAESSFPMIGCHELLMYLQANEIKTAIITRNCLAATHKKLIQNQISVERVITRECFPPKPNPSSLESLAKDWGLMSNEILYVGDYFYDLQAAYNAKMPSCLVHHGKALTFSDAASLALNELSDLLFQFQSLKKN